MYNKIAFIGGIHGVGKSTVCHQICDKIDIEYLSASELIKWAEINTEKLNKKVKCIHETQDRLVIGLNNKIVENKFYLLDGHYSLLDQNNEIVNVPIETFKRINPNSLNIITGKISEIKIRLQNRDKKPYDQDLLRRMQNNELAYAKSLSISLGINLNIGTVSDFSELFVSLYNDNLF